VVSAEIYKSDHPKLFDGFGKIPVRHEIKLRGDYQPFAITTPWCVSIPLLERVRNDLQKMEDIGVIRNVEHPTDWCAGMVVWPRVKVFHRRVTRRKN